MSNKRNSIFSGVVPVMGDSQTVVPTLASPVAGSRILTQAIAQALAETSPTTRHSTGSTLLDSFIGDAAHDAFALQRQLTSLSFELKRVANPRIRRPIARDKTVRDRPIAEQARPRQTKNSDRPQPSAQPSQALPTEAQIISAQIAQAQVAKAQIEKARVEKTHARKATIRPSQPQKVATQKESNPSRQPLPASQKKVYGGSDYKALQARAQAGGLVNLDDWLLFGGADKDKPIGGDLSIQRSQASSHLSSYLSEQLQDFTASPIPGGFHATLHIAQSSSAQQDQHQTVLGVDVFKLSDLTADSILDLVDERAVKEATEKQAEAREKTGVEPVEVFRSSPEAVSNNQPAALDELSKQVIYLNQRIEYLSQKLAMLDEDGLAGDRTHPPQAITATKANGTRSRSHTKGWSPVVLGTEVFTLAESASSPQKRVATLESLSKAL